MIVTAHHDNSANNPMNPAPNQSAGWGEMTSQEMMLPWFGVLVNRDAQPDMIARYIPPDLDAIPGIVFNGKKGVSAKLIKPLETNLPPVKVLK